MYHIRDSPLSEIEFQTHYFKKKNRADIVNDDIMCFDIETSSGFCIKIAIHLNHTWEKVKIL